MDIDNLELVRSLSPEVVQNLRRAVELGKWPNGERLTAEQKATCLQAVIAYEAEHLPPEQRTGYVPPKPAKKTSTKSPDDSEQPIKWQ